MSPIAREQFRRRAQQLDIAAEAFARGLTPVDHMTPALAAAAAEDGIDPRREPVRTLSDADLRNADVVVAFVSPASDHRLTNARHWSDVPSATDNYQKSRNSLLAHIDVLLSELKSRLC